MLLQNTVLGSVLRMQQVLANSSRDPTIPSSKINGGSEVVVNCLMNVISASGDSARVFDAPSAKDQVSEASVNDVSISYLIEKALKTKLAKPL